MGTKRSKRKYRQDRTYINVENPINLSEALGNSEPQEIQDDRGILTVIKTKVEDIIRRLDSGLVSQSIVPQEPEHITLPTTQTKNKEKELSTPYKIANVASSFITAFSNPKNRIDLGKFSKPLSFGKASQTDAEVLRKADDVKQEQEEIISNSVEDALENSTVIGKIQKSLAKILPSVEGTADALTNPNQGLISILIGLLSMIPGLGDIGNLLMKVPGAQYVADAASYVGSKATQAYNYVGGQATKAYDAVAGTAKNIGGSISKYVKLASKSVNLSMLNPSMQSNLASMAEEYYQQTGKKLQINSGYRDPAKQAVLYQEAVRKYGPEQARKHVAPPGRSMHNQGLAVDINSADANYLERSGLLKKYNFHRPLAHEAWHIEPKGITRIATQTVNLVKKIPTAASDTVKAMAKVDPKSVIKASGSIAKAASATLIDGTVLNPTSLGGSEDELNDIKRSTNPMSVKDKEHMESIRNQLEQRPEIKSPVSLDKSKAILDSKNNTNEKGGTTVVNNTYNVSSKSESYSTGGQDVLDKITK